ncbi:hypothetical protein PABG_06504 [Paracoccidioides brasiliensis Pb03]|nr:hypothetical protein PABG_06504 [Paracoccidioides brasiliensis Pb03]
MEMLLHTSVDILGIAFPRLLVNHDIQEFTTPRQSRCFITVPQNAAYIQYNTLPLLSTVAGGIYNHLLLTLRKTPSFTTPASAKMSQSHALSDDQVAGELRKMTAFIRQEALEKAREIQLKADEEFAIEKSKLVRQETAAIDHLYEKKFKQASMSQQITRSTLANKTRLRVLTARQELLDELFEQARVQLASVTVKGAKKGGKKGVGGYQTTLKGLVLEGLYALNERKVQVRARKKDYEVVRKAIGEAEAEFKEKVGRESSVELLESDPLPEGSAGGVIIIGTAGKIDINNTFEERLRLLEIDALPAVRETLFGKNKNRKFYD